MDELLLICSSFIIGIALCACAITPLLRRHDRWMALYGRRWYHGPDWPYGDAE